MSSLGYVWGKVRARARCKLVQALRNNIIYPAMYPAWWRMKLLSHHTEQSRAYLAAVPNPGAGIGHQIANWTAGLWFARVFGLEHAHIPFSTPQWEALLGFGEGKDSLESLVKNNGYRKVSLPLFDEFNQFEVEQIKKIIASYNDKKIVFVLEQDQFYRDQYGVMDDIKHRFYHAAAREKDKLIYSNEHFNIAIHVRRGDIAAGQHTSNPNLLMRWQETNYFKSVLTSILKQLKTKKYIKIYLFSQGHKEDFVDFNEFDNVEYCLNMNAQESFLHMVFSDLLIISKSSFSYKPALLSNGIKVCPRNFWHGYPQDEHWVIAEENGSLSHNAKWQLSTKS